MPISVYLASAGVTCSLFLLRWAFVGGQQTSSAARANLGIGAVKPTRLSRRGSVPADRSLWRGIPFLSKTGDLANRIARAGLPWSVESVQLFRVVSVLGATVLGLLLAAAEGNAVVLLLFVLVGAICAVLPGLVIDSRADGRQREVELQLPDILDRLTVSIEAGLGFDSALAHVVQDKTGPGYDEFRRVLQDLQLGVPRDVALEGLSERTTVQDLRIVLGAIIQSGKYGLPLAGVLRVQTAELREKRWSRAQELAMKVPVKILFPLMFCILPTLFLVIIGPAIIRIAHTF
jgi:tight adherence protein C